MCRSASATSCLAKRSSLVASKRDAYTSALLCRTMNLHREVSRSVLPKLGEPQQLFSMFLACMETPRPSDSCEAFRAKLQEHAAERKFHFSVDKAGNVVIRKPASAGYEDRVKIVIQAHLGAVSSC